MILSYSQGKLIINGDTIVAITPLQLKKANVLFIERKMYKEYADSLFKENKRKEAHILSLQRINNLKTSKNDLLERNLVQMDSINSVKEERIKILNNKIKSEQAKKVKGFFTGTLVGSSLTALLIFIFVK